MKQIPVLFNVSANVWYYGGHRELQKALLGVNELRRVGWSFFLFLFPFFRFSVFISFFRNFYSSPSWNYDPGCRLIGAQEQRVDTGMARETESDIAVTAVCDL